MKKMYGQIALKYYCYLLRIRKKIDFFCFCFRISFYLLSDFKPPESLEQNNGINTQNNYFYTFTTDHSKFKSLPDAIL